MNIFSFSHFTVRFSEEWKLKSEEWRGVSALRKLVGPSGLEPPTSCLSGTRSNLLSYDPSWLVKWFFTWMVEMMVIQEQSGFACFARNCFSNCTHAHFCAVFEIGTNFQWDLSRPFGTKSVPWWRWWDSNPWPPACRAGALPAELHPHFLHTALLHSAFPLGFAFLYLFLTLGVDFTPLLRLVSALNYLPVQSPVKYCRHCRA